MVIVGGFLFLAFTFMSSACFCKNVNQKIAKARLQGRCSLSDSFLAFAVFAHINYIFFSCYLKDAAPPLQ